MPFWPPSSRRPLLSAAGDIVLVECRPLSLLLWWVRVLAFGIAPSVIFPLPLRCSETPVDRELSSRRSSLVWQRFSPPSAGLLATGLLALTGESGRFPDEGEINVNGVGVLTGDGGGGGGTVLAEMLWEEAIRVEETTVLEAERLVRDEVGRGPEERASSRELVLPMPPAV